MFDYKAAIADYDAAIARARTADSYQQRAGLKAALGDDAAALADVEEALKLDPGSEDALAQKVGLLAELGRTGEALAMADEQMAGAKDKRGWISLKAEDRKSTRLNPVNNAPLVCRLLLEQKKKKNI